MCEAEHLCSNLLEVAVSSFSDEQVTHPPRYLPLPLRIIVCPLSSNYMFQLTKGSDTYVYFWSRAPLSRSFRGGGVLIYRRTGDPPPCIKRHGTSGVNPCQGHVRYVQATSLCGLSLAERGLTPSERGATVCADIAVTRLYRSLLWR